jgi:glucose/arabinose dehydrogenase
MQGGGFLLHPLDGCLYIGTGDNGRPEETPRFFDDPKFSSQNLTDLRGKILRLNRDGSVPGDNPFVGRADARPEIYALGLRNPFSLSVHPTTGHVYIGDVGYNRREDWEEINLLQSGANYGWPRCDGRNRDTLASTPCPIGEAVGPWFGYPHESASAVLVGPFLTQAPKGWPAQYSHGLIYADFSRRSIRFAQVDAARNIVTNTVPIASGLTGGPLGMSMGPGGDLFLVEYAGWLSGHHQDRLSRIHGHGVERAGSGIAVPAVPGRRPFGGGLVK